MSDRLRQIETLFHAALAKPADARDGFLAEACNGDETLRKEVSELLALTSDDNGIFEHPPVSDPGFELAAGSRLGPYEIEALIGAGGMGEVYRARDTRLGRQVALKLLPARFRANPALRARFEREAKAVAGLTHPNVCALHDIGHDRGLDFLVMEYVDGETVAEALRRGPLPIEAAVRVGTAVASALAAAHARGLVHRDVKPSNIIMTRDGVPKLVDFGLAAMATGCDTPAGDDSRVTRTGVFVGTLQYMSPEQAVRQPVDARSDLFSLGVVLFECLTGARPFEGDTQSAYLRNLFLARPQSIRAFRSDVPVPLEQIVTRCLEKDAAARQISASEIASALTDLAGPSARRRTARVAGWAAAIVAVVTAATAAAWKWDTNSVKRLESASKGRDAGVHFHAREWVLVTTFDNRTGDRQFDRTIESALEYELNNSAYVNVVPPNRIDAALKLMVKPADTTVDATVGREVARRDGDIRLVIGGEIERLGAGYAITVRVTDPFTGETTATTREEAVGTDGVQRAVRRVSNWVRLTLGEAPVLVKNDDMQLERVTTPSPRALQLYTEARRVFDRNDGPAAEAMLSAALAEDPNFASAHIWMAWTFANLKRPQDVIAAEAKRAADLAGTTTERERYWILASYYILTLQDQLAVGQLEALTQRFPNDYWATRNLADTYIRLGRTDDAAQVAPRLADAQPENFFAQAAAAWTLVRTNGIAAAQTYVERSKRLLAQANPSSERFGDATKLWVVLLPAHEQWAAGHAADAARVLDSASGRPEFRMDPVNALNMLGKLRLALGQLTMADQAFDGIPDRGTRVLGKSEVALARNDVAAVTRMLNAARPADFAAASIMVQAGDPEDAQRLLDEMPQHDARAAHARWTAEQIREARGDVDQITEGLRNGLPWVAVMTGARTFSYSETLARAAAKLGKVDRAIALLEQISPLGERTYVSFSQSGFHWMRAQKLLADLYRQTGQIDKARAIEQDLLARLAVADPDYPLLIELKRRASAKQPQDISAANQSSARAKDK